MMEIFLISTALLVFVFPHRPTTMYQFKIQCATYCYVLEYYMSSDQRTYLKKLRIRRKTSA